MYAGDILNTSNHSKIFVVGSINIDYCTIVDALPKVGETVLSKSFEIGLGGKGANQAVACSKLGCDVYMIGAVGDDAFGSDSIAQLKEYGVKTESISVLKGQNTGMAFVTVSKSDNSIVVASNANFSLDFETIKKHLSSATINDILIVQLELDLDVVKATLEYARGLGMTTILNAAPADVSAISLCPHVDICVLNETECHLWTDVHPVDEVHVVLAAKKLYEYGVSSVVLTLGEHGSVIVKEQTVDYVDAIKTTVVDTTSAGDAYIGAMASKLASGHDLVKSAHFATKVASITVSRSGASKSIPTLDEIQNSKFE